jgi:hypothetical protein
MRLWSRSTRVSQISLVSLPPIPRINHEQHAGRVSRFDEFGAMRSSDGGGETDGDTVGNCAWLNRSGRPTALVRVKP